MIPVFNIFYFNAMHHELRSCIAIGEKPYFHIADRSEFLEALGYTLKQNSMGLLLDEYIYEEFIKPDSPRCERCFQLLIYDYLHKHSSKFIEEHGYEYIKLQNECNSAL